MDKFEESETVAFLLANGPSLKCYFFLKASIIFIYFPCHNGHINIKQANQNTQKPKYKSAAYADESTNCCTVLFSITLLYHTT